MEMKKAQLGLPHLEQIIEDIDRFNLEIWEPELALEGLTTAWQAFGSQSDTDYKARAAALLERMARVNPAAALRVAK
jgi:type VI secretion system protein VasJ